MKYDNQDDTGNILPPALRLRRERHAVMYRAAWSYKSGASKIAVVENQ